MNNIAYYILFIVCFISFHCKNVSETILFDVPDGTYAYFSYDSSSTLVAKGWFKFEHEDSANIKGIWEIKKVGNPGNIGPQDGEGELVGMISDTSVSINLHPNFADNNIILAGKIDNKYIYGKWHWATFAGITNWGSFNSKKN